MLINGVFLTLAFTIFAFIDLLAVDQARDKFEAYNLIRWPASSFLEYAKIPVLKKMSAQRELKDGI